MTGITGSVQSECTHSWVCVISKMNTFIFFHFSPQLLDLGVKDYTSKTYYIKYITLKILLDVI